MCWISGFRQIGTTRPVEVVRHRLEKVPPIRFFSETEAQTLAAVAERIIPQPERKESEKMPIVPWIDEKLYEDKRDGYRYENLPPQREAWRKALAGIDESAAILFKGRRFVDLDAESQDEVLKQVQKGDPPGEIWTQLPSQVILRAHAPEDRRQNVLHAPACLE